MKLQTLTKNGFLAMLLAGAATGSLADEHRLWYRTPAADSIQGWERQSLPIGNGWFGVNVFGIVTNERVQVTHNAVLSTYEKDGRCNLTDALEIRIETKHAAYAGYSRGLDLETATAWVKYESGGVKFVREFFTSYPDRAMGMRLTASKKGALDFTIRAEAPFLRPFGQKVGKGVKGRTAACETARDAIDVYQHLERFDILFDARLKVETDGVCEKAGDGALRVCGATDAKVYFVCDTNYEPVPEAFLPPNRAVGPDPRPRVKGLLEKAVRKGYAALRKEHRKDVKNLLGRVELDLEAEDVDEKVPTDELLKRYAKGGRSAYLEETYFQYGRYLLVSSSRPGTLPANLQGVWTAYDESPWGCGYWHNINVQMNYWPAFSANLAECFRAYADFNKAFRPVSKGGAWSFVKRYTPENLPADKDACDWWTVGTAVFPYGAGGGPGGHSGPGTGGLTTKLFMDWWLFTRDEQALRDYVWPTIHGMANFLTRCVTETNGLYLSKFSASPEQLVTPGGKYNQAEMRKLKNPYYNTTGCAFDQQMIWENNHDLLLLAKELGREDEVVATVRRQIDKYDPVQVGESGQIKEYREERKYGEIGEYDHRHISQLVGLMPGTLITRDTPAWMAAARYTLTERGDKSTGWALAHRLCSWARALDGDHAYLLLGNLLAQRTFDNLWDAHPPFQIDGNFGATAGVVEMLLQSHAGYIDLLPALPKAWAKKGSFEGLCARGAFVVDCAWKDGKPTEVTVRSLKGLKPDVRFAGRPCPFRLK